MSHNGEPGKPADYLNQDYRMYAQSRAVLGDEKHMIHIALCDSDVHIDTDGTVTLIDPLWFCRENLGVVEPQHMSIFLEKASACLTMDDFYALMEDYRSTMRVYKKRYNK